MKKSRFFALLCAFIPGAGQMYMGLMKRGAATMGLFALGIFISVIIPPAMVFLPIIWFYSFFDTLNLRNTTWEQLEELQRKDNLFFSQLLDQSDTGKEKLRRLFDKSHLVIGWALVACGAYALYNRFGNWLWDFAYQTDNPVMRSLARFMDSLPTFLVSALLICFGVYLIRGKKKAPPLPPEEDFAPYRGSSSQAQQSALQDAQASDGLKGE